MRFSIRIYEPADDDLLPAQTCPPASGQQGANAVCCMHREQAVKSTFMLELLAEAASCAK
jgi:hypothetical protein